MIGEPSQWKRHGTEDAGPTTCKSHILGEPSVEGLARYILQHDIRNILVLIGAGVSVAAGIPDFRSPNTGLYAKLEKYDLEDPADAFSLSLLRESPAVFYTIANEMNLWPGARQPTAVHHFVKLLSDEGRLLRCCTQNIDGLERAAGVPEERLVEAHGTFRTASCIDCHHPFDIQRNREDAQYGVISRCEECGGIVKPDVVFFGEQLPEAFFTALTEDTKVADLVLIIGTSLQVRPFALLPLYVRAKVPRVLINMYRVGGRMFHFPQDFPSSEGRSGQLLESASSASAEAHGPALSSPEERVAVQGEESSRTPPQQSERHDEESAAVDAVGCSDAHSPPPQAVEGAWEKDERLKQEEQGAERSDDDSGDDGKSTSSSSSDGFLEYDDVAPHLPGSAPEVLHDAFFPGDCQETVKRLAAAMGLGGRLISALVASPVSANPLS